MDGRPTWTDCDEAGDYVVPNVLSPRDLVFRPDNMDETVPHINRHRSYGIAKYLNRVLCLSCPRLIATAAINVVFTPITM